MAFDGSDLRAPTAAPSPADPSPAAGSGTRSLSAARYPLQRRATAPPAAPTSAPAGARTPDFFDVLDDLHPSDRASGPHDEVAAPAERTAEIDALITHVEQVIASAAADKIRRETNDDMNAPIRERAEARREGKEPDLTGLGQHEILDTVAGAVRTLSRQWPSLNEPQRRDGMGAASNVGLNAIGVPSIKRAVESERDATASFFFPTWDLWVNKDVTKGDLDEEAAGRVCEVVAHEARHAEQYFLSARMMAARGAEPDKIHADLRIPLDIATAAHGQPLGEDAAANTALAEEMRQSTFENRDENKAIYRDTGYEVLERARKEAATALERLRLNPSPASAEQARWFCAELERAIAAVDRKHRAYRGIRHEADAYEVGVSAHVAFEHAK